jgi:hypothetical protein
MQAIGFFECDITWVFLLTCMTELNFSLVPRPIPIPHSIPSVQQWIFEMLRVGPGLIFLMSHYFLSVPPPSSFSASSSLSSAPKLNYTILFNSSRSLKFQQLIFGSPNKPDGRVGTTWK